MAANIFVDMATTVEVMEGNCASLSEFFRQHVNKNSDADIHTEPAIVFIEDDLLKVFSSRATFEFEAASGEVTYIKHETERNETDIFDVCFDGNLRYVAERYKGNASRVVFALTTIFMNFFADGKDGLSEMVKTISNGRFDYDQNKQGDWRFWYRHSDGKWVRSSLCLFTNYLYNISRDNLKYKETDEYFIDWLIDRKKAHIGYKFIGYMNFIAAHDTRKKPIQNKTEATGGGDQKNPLQANEEQIKTQTQPDGAEKVKSTSTQTQSSAVKNEPLVENVIYRKKKLNELTMADCNEISRKFLRKLYESGTDKVKKLYFCSLQDTKSQKNL